jgi:hypothetical protein
MKSEHVRQLTDGALRRLTTALEAGHSETLTAFLATAARFHRYSFRNVMLIAMQRPDATRVAGFRAWKKLGRFVKRGEKGIAIIAPLPVRNPTPPDDDEGDSGVRFKAVYVFDVAQTDGESLPALARTAGDPAEATDRLRALIQAKGITLEYRADLDGADGQSSGGHIAIRTGLPAAEEFSVLVHELAHEFLHHQGGDNPRPAKVVRETEAEAVAFIVAHGIGLDTTTAASDYIQLYNGDAATLARSLERVQQTAAHILSALLPEADAPDHDPAAA